MYWPSDINKCLPLWVSYLLVIASAQLFVTVMELTRCENVLVLVCYGWHIFSKISCLYIILLYIRAGCGVGLSYPLRHAHSLSSNVVHKSTRLEFYFLKRIVLWVWLATLNSSFTFHYWNSNIKLYDGSRLLRQWRGFFNIAILQGTDWFYIKSAFVDERAALAVTRF